MRTLNVVMAMASPSSNLAFCCVCLRTKKKKVDWSKAFNLVHPLMLIWYLNFHLYICLLFCLVEKNSIISPIVYLAQVWAFTSAAVMVLQLLQLHPTLRLSSTPTLQTTLQYFVKLSLCLFTRLLQRLFMHLCQLLGFFLSDFFEMYWIWLSPL